MSEFSSGSLKEAHQVSISAGRPVAAPASTPRHPEGTGDSGARYFGPTVQAAAAIINIRAMAERIGVMPLLYRGDSLFYRSPSLPAFSGNRLSAAPPGRSGPPR